MNYLARVAGIGERREGRICYKRADGIYYCEDKYGNQVYYCVRKWNFWDFAFFLFFENLRIEFLTKK